MREAPSQGNRGRVALYVGSSPLVRSRRGFPHCSYCKAHCVIGHICVRGLIASAHVIGAPRTIWVAARIGVLGMHAARPGNTPDVCCFWAERHRQSEVRDLCTLQKHMGEQACFSPDSITTRFCNCPDQSQALSSGHQDTSSIRPTVQCAAGLTTAAPSPVTCE